MGELDSYERACLNWKITRDFEVWEALKVRANNTHYFGLSDSEYLTKFMNLRCWKFTLNKFRYLLRGTAGNCLDSGVDHYVLWIRIKHNDDLIKTIIEKWSDCERKDVLYWFENPMYKRSVIDLSHVHVFCKSPHFSYAKQCIQKTQLYATMESNSFPNVPNSESVLCPS